jgi:hypothetical protein
MIEALITRPLRISGSFDVGSVLAMVRDRVSAGANCNAAAETNVLICYFYLLKELFLRSMVLEIGADEFCTQPCADGALGTKRLLISASVHVRYKEIDLQGREGLISDHDFESTS